MDEFPCKDCVVKPVCNPEEDEYPIFTCNINQKQIIACQIFQEWTSRKIIEYIETLKPTHENWRINELNR